MILWDIFGTPKLSSTVSAYFAIEQAPLLLIWASVGLIWASVRLIWGSYIGVKSLVLTIQWFYMILLILNYICIFVYLFGETEDISLGFKL